MLKNPNRPLVPSSESLDPGAAASSSYSLGLDDRFKGKLNASDLDAEALFNEDLRKQEEAKQLAQMEEAQLAQLVQDDLEAYLNQRPDEYGKDPNGNLLPPKEDLYDRTLNEARHEREATSLTDLATAAGEALARGDKTMADDLQGEILQGIADRAETHNWDQSTIDRRLSDLTRVMNDTEAARLKEQQTTTPATPPRAPESAPTTPATSESSGQSEPEGLGGLSGEDGNDDEVLDMTRLLAAEEYKKRMDSVNWYRDAYRASSRDTAFLEKQAQLLMVSNWYDECGIIYAKLRDTQLALAKPSISSNARQALISKEGTLISALKDLENIKPSSDLAVYNKNGEPNSQSEQNKNGGGEQPKSKDTNAGKENGEKWRRFKKFGEWFIRVSGINEPTSSIDTASKSSDGTGNTLDKEQRVKVKVPRKQPPNPIPKRQVRRKSSTNATN